jgi:hypothetical protein
MTLHVPQQPNLRFLDQIIIASCLFYFILDTKFTHEDLEHSWETISHDIEIQE